MNGQISKMHSMATETSLSHEKDGDAISCSMSCSGAPESEIHGEKQMPWVLQIRLENPHREEIV